MVTKDYEILFILKPDLTEEEVTAQIKGLTDFITSKEGVVTGEDRWGKRRLAYPMRKQRYGYYTLLLFTLKSGFIPEFERSFQFNENFLKSLVTIFVPVPERKENSNDDDRDRDRDRTPANQEEKVAVAETVPAEAPVETSDE